MEGFRLSSRGILIKGSLKLIYRPSRIISNLSHSVTPFRMFWPSFFPFCLSRLRRLSQFLVLNLLDESDKFPLSHSDLLRFVCWLRIEWHFLFWAVLEAHNLDRYCLNPSKSLIFQCWHLSLGFTWMKKICHPISILLQVSSSLRLDALMPFK
jgi:hypothetical protein